MGVSTQKMYIPDEAAPPDPYLVNFDRSLEQTLYGSTFDQPMNKRVFHKLQQKLMPHLLNTEYIKSSLS